MNTPVSFELAKLLKEKGFDAYCDKKYIAQCLWQKPNSREKYKNSEIHKNSGDISAPTIAEVVMWLYEKYGVWIEVSCHTVLDEKDDDVDVFYFVIRKLKPVNILYSGDFVNSPTEAYEAAIEYTLNNLL